MENTRVLDATPRLKRAANEILRGTAAPDDTLPLPYYCECDDPACRVAIWLTASAYDRLQAGPDSPPLLVDEHRPFLARAG